MSDIRYTNCFETFSKKSRKGLLQQPNRSMIDGLTYLVVSLSILHFGKQSYYLVLIN